MFAIHIITKTSWIYVKHVVGLLSDLIDFSLLYVSCSGL